MLGLEELSEKDRATVHRARRLERFMTQPFFSTERMTGTPGCFVELEDNLSSCEMILSDAFPKHDEADFYMIGSVKDMKRGDRNAA